MHTPGELRPILGEFSDLMGQKILEALGKDPRDVTPNNVSVPMNEIMVTNSGDSGMGSLRWAIQQANANPGPDVIHFSMNGTSISPLTDLPPIMDNDTVIDASPNWSGSWPTVDRG